jgi:4-amino-4-deoxy-L-arabinose transferase-like glycosyltransferase
MRMSRPGKLGLVSLVLIAAGLRYQGLFGNTFHADEALFASWARLIAVWRDPLLQSQIVDKPPLLFYLQAFFYPLFGPVEWAARMPDFVASLLLVPLTGLLAWQLYRDELSAILAAAFITFSPLAIQFSATAFTDPIMTVLLMAALYSAVCVRPFGPASATSRPAGRLAMAFWSGLWFGLAAAAKYQAWLFLPLIIALGALMRWRRPEWVRWLAGLLPVLAIVVAWELARGEGFTLFEEQLASFGGIRIAWSWELWPRLEAWGQLWGYAVSSPILGFGLLLAIPPFLALLIYDQDSQTAIDQILVLFLAGYILLHWLMAIPVWDRYLLPLMPIVGLILGRFVWRLYAFVRTILPPQVTERFITQRTLWLAPFLLVALQATAVLDARAGRLPIGGNTVADDGVSQIVTSLADAPYGTVLYDHWYSWQWRYQLFDQPVYVSWFPHPEALAADLAVFGHEEAPRYIALPHSAAAIPVRRAIEDAGFDLLSIHTAHDPDGLPSLTLYQVVPR